jgi:hypothetical protein
MSDRPAADRACLHLRSKEMFYKDAAAGPTEHDREVRKHFGSCDTRACWCALTQTGRGPDDRPVNATACGDPGRACYAGIGSLA